MSETTNDVLAAMKKMTPEQLYHTICIGQAFVLYCATKDLGKVPPQWLMQSMQKWASFFPDFIKRHENLEVKDADMEDVYVLLSQIAKNKENPDAS